MSGCVNIALRDILAGSAAGGYGCQPLKAGGAAQPGGCSACFVPVEPGSWDLSMKVPCFVDGGRVLVCLSMKSLDFMDGWGLVGSLRLEFLCGIAAVTFGKIACKYYICMVNN